MEKTIKLIERLSIHSSLSSGDSVTVHRKLNEIIEQVNMLIQEKSPPGINLSQK